MKIIVEKIICLFIILLIVDTAYSLDVIKVSTDVCVLSLDKINGNFAGLHWLNPDGEIIKEPRLGENFRILLPNGMRYGLVWAMAPRHYNASMDEAVTRPLSEYVAELIRIRKKYADILFNGWFMDTLGASVKCGPNSRFSIFQPMNGSAKKAVVLVNYDNKEDEMEVNFDNVKNETADLSIPFQTSRLIQLPAKIKVPPRSCAVVVLDGE